MSAIAWSNHSVPNRPAAIAGDQLRNAIVAVPNLVRRFVAIQRYRRTLEHLSDAVLNDIGVDRDDIPRVVRDNLDEAGRPSGRYPF